MDERHGGPQRIMCGAPWEMASEAGDGFRPVEVNLVVYCRRSGLVKSKAGAIKGCGFCVYSSLVKINSALLSGMGTLLLRISHLLDLPPIAGSPRAQS